MNHLGENGSIVILGAGITGLTAAWELSRSFPGRVILLEKESKVGGLADTAFTKEQFAFDTGSHRLHEDNHPKVNQLIRDLCGPDLLKRERKGQIYIQDKPFRYPPSALDIMTAFGLKDFARFGFGFLFSRIRQMFQKTEPGNFEDYITSKVGKGLYTRFYRPYAMKLYGMSPRSIAKDPAINRVRKFKPAAMIQDVRDKISGKKTRTYLYPAKGIGQLSTALKEKFLNNGGQLVFISQLESICLKNDNVIDSITYRTQNGSRQDVAVGTFISTISLDILHDLIKFESEKAKRPEFTLRWRALRLLHLVTSDKVQSEHETYYFPESHIPFGRVSEIGKYSPALISDPDRTLLTIEIPCSPGDQTWDMGDDQLAEVCTSGLQKLGILRNPMQGTTTSFSRKLDKIYPVYDLGWKERFDRVYDRLNQVQNLYMIGRGALFLHCNIDHCMLMAIKLNEYLSQGHADKTEWEGIRKEFFNYRVRE